MKTVKVDKKKLIVIVRANRERHVSIFEEAAKNYRAAVITELDRMLEDARQGRKIRRAIQLAEPFNQTEQYDRVLRMLELSLDQEIELTETDFAQYVMDDWNWMRQFTQSNRSYIRSFDNTAYLARKGAEVDE